MRHECETGFYVSDKSIKADNGSSISNSKIINFVKSNTEMFLGFMLGLALIEGAALFYEWRHKAQKSELERQAFIDFQTFTFNPLVAEVKSDHDLIQAYGLQKALAETCRSK